MKILVWCLSQYLLALVMVQFCARILDFSPSKLIYEDVKSMILPSFIFLLVAVAVTIFATTKFSFAFRSSRWFSTFALQPVLLSALLGLVPAGVSFLACRALGQASIEWRPPELSFPVLQALLLLVVLFLNAAFEEIQFRMVPIAMVESQEKWLAFLVPVGFFIVAHFLEAGRDLSFWRVLQLGFASLPLFLLATRHGLFAATLTHMSMNAAQMFSDGRWSQGALAKIHWPEDHQLKLAMDSLGYLILALIVVVIFGFATSVQES